MYSYVFVVQPWLPSGVKGEAALIWMSASVPFTTNEMCASYGTIPNEGCRMKQIVNSYYDHDVSSSQASISFPSKDAL
jgi:hypothetical protein